MLAPASPAGWRSRSARSATSTARRGTPTSCSTSASCRTALEADLRAAHRLRPPRSSTTSARRPPRGVLRPSLPLLEFLLPQYVTEGKSTSGRDRLHRRPPPLGRITKDLARPVPRRTPGSSSKSSTATSTARPRAARRPRARPACPAFHERSRKGFRMPCQYASASTASAALAATSSRSARVRRRHRGRRRQRHHRHRDARAPAQVRLGLRAASPARSRSATARSTIDGREVKALAERDPAPLPWATSASTS